MTSRLSIEYPWNKSNGGHSKQRYWNHGHISFFSDQVIKDIRRRQESKPFLTGVKIESYHHEPARRDLERLGVRDLDTAEIGIGVSDEVHAAFHYANYILTGDESHSHDVTAIICRWEKSVSDARNDVYEKIVNGPMFDKIKEEVVQRRKKWGLAG